MLRPFYLTISFPCLAFLVQCYPALIDNKTLPSPHRKLLLLIVILAELCFLFVLLWHNMEGSSLNVNILAKVLHSFGTAINIVIHLVIGVSAGNIIFSLENLEVQRSQQPENDIELLISDFQNLKRGLSPLLLVLYLSNTVFIINYLYLCINIADSRQAQTVLFQFLFPIICWNKNNVIIKGTVKLNFPDLDINLW